VIVVTMFLELAAGWADLVLPATAGFERDGTVVNLEGRVQRLRRAVAPPCPDEQAWVAELAARFGVDLSPHPALLFVEAGEQLFPGLTLEEVGLRAPLPIRSPYEARLPLPRPQAPAVPAPADAHFVGALRLQRYRPLFSGPAVERVPELAFQRPDPEIELSVAEAGRRGISTGDAVLVRSNGTSVELRARVSRRLVDGVARIADEHAGDLHATVEVVAIPLREMAGGDNE
jgi:predicted molibdopterin-dependent oxidoreductase YjgC